jgi:hypothetical protein
MATTLFIPPSFRTNPDQPAEFSSDLLGDLVRMSATKAQKATAAVAGRRREMEEQGRIPYVPAQPKIVDDLARSAASRAGLPLPKTADVQTVQQRPTGGKIVNYPSGEKIVMGLFGSGTRKEGPKKPTIIEGKPAAQYFAETAASQGKSNKFAAALPTGKKDELGREKFRGIAFEDSDKMSPEKQKALIFDAMNRKKA